MQIFLNNKTTSMIDKQFNKIKNKDKDVSFVSVAEIVITKSNPKRYKESKYFYKTLEIIKSNKISDKKKLSIIKETAIVLDRYQIEDLDLTSEQITQLLSNYINFGVYEYNYVIDFILEFQNPIVVEEFCGINSVLYSKNIIKTKRIEELQELQSICDSILNNFKLKE